MILLSIQLVAGCKLALADRNYAGSPRWRHQTSKSGRTCLRARKREGRIKKSYNVEMAFCWKGEVFCCGTFHSSGKAPPVGEDHQRQVLTVEVRNGLSGFEGWIWEPHLAGLLQHLRSTHEKWSQESETVWNQQLQSHTWKIRTLDSESRLAGSAGTVNSTERVSTAMTPRGIPPNLSLRWNTQWLLQTHHNKTIFCVVLCVCVFV